MPDDKPYTPEEAIAQAMEAGDPTAALAKLKELGFALEPVEPPGDDDATEDDGPAPFGKGPLGKMRGATMDKVKAKHGDF